VKSPPHLANGDSKRWKCVGREINWSKGQDVEITESWQYDYFAWADSIMPLMTKEQMEKIIAKMEAYEKSLSGKGAV
jgi:hypothetical protein